jgi:hypothetical protein
MEGVAIGKDEYAVIAPDLESTDLMRTVLPPSHSSH